MAIATAEPVSVKCGLETFTLQLGFSAICEIEKEFDMPFQRFAEQMTGAEMRMSHLLAIFRALLLKNHRDMTTEKAADLIEEIGAEKTGALIVEAFEASPMFKTAAPPATRPATRDATRPRGRKAT